VAVVAVVAAAGYRRLAERRQQVCRGAGDRLAAVWNPARRAALGRTFLTAGVADGAGLWGATEVALGRYLDGWVASYTDACEATRFRGDQSTQLLDLRMACLEGRRQEFAALVDLLADGDPARLERAPEAAAALTPLVRCADARALLAPVPPPASAEVRSGVAALRPRLARAKALEDLGQYAAGIELAQGLAGEAAALGYWPLTAEALLRLGILEERDGRPEAAETLGQAAEAAAAGGDARAAAEAFTHLVRVYAYVKADHDRARRYADLATAALSRLGEPGELEAELADYRGRLAYQQADYQGALEQHLRALALKRRILGDEHPEVAASLLRIATVRGELGALGEARADARRAVAIYRRALGPSHPRLVAALLNLGNFQYRDNDLQAALATDQRALDLALRVFGPGHRQVADARYHLGAVYFGLGRVAEALAQFHQALDAFTAELGPDHPRVAEVLSAIASAEERRGDQRAALGLYRRALAIQEKVYDGDHPWVAATLYNLGVAVKELGEAQTAEGYFRRCLKIWEASYGEHHYLVAHALTGLGQALIGEGRPAEALAPLERALAMGDVYASDESQLGDVEFALARALMESGGDRERASSLAAAASGRFRRAGQDRAEDLAKVEDWLTAHPKGDPS
jgi:eukaryotic-like serine/threonine-protein kinase